MRRGTWILAMSGAMALNAGGAFAAEPDTDPAFAQVGVPTRYSRSATPPKPPTTSSTKNFYDELFGDDPLAAELPAAETPSKGTPPQTPVTTTRPASAPPTKRIPLDDPSKTPAPESDRVMHAAHSQAPGQPNQSFIQPVRATGTESASKATPRAASPRAGDQTHSTPSVIVDWVKQSDINVGQECQIDLVARNTGNAPASQVTLEATFPSSVRLTSAEPKPTASGDKLTWTFDSLPVGGEKRIAIKLIPSRRGDLGTSAEVRFSSQSGTVFKVEEPLLKIAVKGPREVLLGDPASQLITVSNPGTGTANNVKLEAVLSEGLEHPRGNRLTIEIGSISPGDSQTVRIGLSAVKGGEQSMQIAATSSSEASSVAVEKIQVIAPSLKVAVDGPGLRYKGRSATYVTSVTNDGTVANNNVRVTQHLPEGFQFVSADRGGKYDAAQRTIHWFLGRMEGGQTSQVSCELVANSLGDFGHQVVVVSDAGVRSEAKTDTTVKGVASLGTEIVDLDDPVEVGAETAWEVRVRNDGSKAATNIALICELPDEVELLSARGPTQAVAENRQVIYKALPQLAPGQQAIFRVHVKGAVEGTHRLRAKVTSDALEEPLLMEEATKFYADTKK